MALHQCNAWPNRICAKEQQWWLICYCKHLCGIINTCFEMTISHPNVGQGQINPVSAELGYMTAPSLFPNGYLFPLCPFNSFNVSPTSSITWRGHKQITGCCLGRGMRSREGRESRDQEFLIPEPSGKSYFFPSGIRNISAMLK